MKKILFTLLIVLVCGGLVFAGAQTEKKMERPSIRFATTWGAADSKGVYFKPMLEAFKAEHADEFDLVVEEYGSDDMVTKITVELSSGQLPDAFSYWGGKQRLGPLAEGGVLLDMEKYFAQSDLSADDFSAAGISHFTIGGKLLGLPMESNVAAFVINKEMFDKFGLTPPKTYEDMRAAGKVLRANGIIPFAMASNGGNPSHFWFSEMYKQYAGGLDDIMNIDSTKRFATPTAYKVAEVIADMKANDLLPADTVSNGNWGPAFALFNEEKAAMIYTYPWVLGSMSPAVQAKSLVINVPQLPGSTEDTSTFISGFSTFGFVVSKASYENTAKTQALNTFIDFMISDKVFNELMKGGLIPTKKYEMDTSSFNDVMKQVLGFYKDHDQTTAHFWKMDDPAVANAFKGALDELYAGIISPKEMVDKVQKAFDNSDL